MADKQFPVSFNFKAFESISGVIDGINGKFGKLKDRVTESNNRFQVLQNGTQGVRDRLVAFGEKLTGIGTKVSLGISTPLSLLAAKMVHTSIEATETASKFDQVFKALDDGTKAAAVDRLKAGFDLSTQSAQELISTTGLLAKDLGLNSKQALNMGEQVAALGVQIAAFRNVEGGAAAATDTLRAAMLGQTKGLKKLGIDLTDAQILEEAKTMASKGARFETIEQAKALVVLSLIQKRTKDDQEDFKESSHELANQMRVGAEGFKEVSKVVGDILKPRFARMVALTNKFQKAFLDLSPGMQKFIVSVGSILIALGPVILGFGVFIGTILPALITGFTTLTAISLPVVGTFLAVVAAIAALIGIGYLVVKNWEAIKTFFLALWDGPLVKFLRWVTMIEPFIILAKTIIANWEPIKGFFQDLFAKIATFMDPIIAKFRAISDAAKSLMGIAGDLGSKLLFGDNNPFAAQAPGGLAGASVGANAQNSVGQAAAVGAQAQQIGKTIGAEMKTTNTNNAKIEIDFSNVPRGTRVQTTQSTGIPPTLNLGMAGGLL